MAPSADSPVSSTDAGKSRLDGPLTYAGLLDAFEHDECTPAIGREYKSGLQLVELLNAENSDDLVRDLAITVSQRGVVFLRDQDINPLQMKEIIEKMSHQSGAPVESELHIHPLTKDNAEHGGQIGTISSQRQRLVGALTEKFADKSRLASNGWHSDITFERVPSDYAMLKIHTLPKTGGDTLWASACEIYDRLSPPMQALLEGLTATHDGSMFKGQAERLGHPIRTKQRGNPLNEDGTLEAVHPVIRTNPVTGWKSVFVNKAFTRRINGITKDESDLLLDYLFSLVPNNHDAQVRFKWNKNDIAIWDNRSTFHSATFDFKEVRTGDRVCSLGEAPYLDPASASRRAAVA